MQLVAGLKHWTWNKTKISTHTHTEKWPCLGYKWRNWKIVSAIYSNIFWSIFECCVRDTMSVLMVWADIETVAGLRHEQGVINLWQIGSVKIGWITDDDIDPNNNYISIVMSWSCRPLGETIVKVTTAMILILRLARYLATSTSLSRLVSDVESIVV